MLIIIARASQESVAARQVTNKRCEVVVGFIPFLIVGVIAGWIAGKIMRGGGYGLFGNLVLGMIGAFVGGNVIDWFGLEASGGMVPAIATASLGAIILLWVVGLFKS